MPLDKWRLALEINLTGYFLAAREAARIMRAQGDGGSMVMLSSKTGLDASKANSAYNATDRKSTRLNSSHLVISYAVFCLKKNRGHSRSPRTAVRHIGPAGSAGLQRGWRWRADCRGRSSWTEGRDLSPRGREFFFNDTAPTEIYPLPLHGALPI